MSASVGPGQGALTSPAVARAGKIDPRATDPRYCLFLWFAADAMGLTPEAYARAELSKAFRIANRARRNGPLDALARHDISRATRMLWAARNQALILESA